MSLIEPHACARGHRYGQREHGGMPKLDRLHENTSCQTAPHSPAMPPDVRKACGLPAIYVLTWATPCSFSRQSPYLLAMVYEQTAHVQSREWRVAHVFAR